MTDNLVFGEIKVKGKNVLVQNTPTKDPTLIGLAFLSAIEKQKNKPPLDHIVDYFFNYLIENKNRRIKKKKDLLEAIYNYNGAFSTKDIHIELSNKINICKATVHNVFKLLESANIINQIPNNENKREAKYILNPYL